MRRKASELKTNYNEAVEVAEGLTGILRRREYPFNLKDHNSLFPDKNIPKGMRAGSKRHSLFLFHTCVLDESSLAEIVYEAMRSFSEEEDITQLHRMDKSELLEKITPHFTSFGSPENAISKPIETLYHNTRKLQSEYKGDPRLILGENIDATIKAIMFGKTKKPKDKFKRYGIGKAALLMKNFVEFGMWDLSPYEIPTKIDRHMQRISLGKGVVTAPKGMTRGRIDTLVKTLTEVYGKVCKQEKISAVDLCDSKWGVGHYKCMKNNDVYCQTTCPISCDYRPRLIGTRENSTKTRPVYFVPESEMRKNVDNLFRYARENTNGDVSES